MGWITEKPNRYPIFLKTDTEYRTDFYKNRPKNRKPTPTQNTDTDPPLVCARLPDCHEIRQSSAAKPENISKIHSMLNRSHMSSPICELNAFKKFQLLPSRRDRAIRAKIHRPGLWV